MAQFDDNMTGIIGKNDYKEKDTHPDKKGRCKIHGIWFWVSGWDKVSSGRPFTSLAFTEMTSDEAKKVEEKQAQRQAPQGQGNFPSQQGQSQQQQPQQQQAATEQPPAARQSEASQVPMHREPPMDFDDDIPF